MATHRCWEVVWLLLRLDVEIDDSHRTMLSRLQWFRKLWVRVPFEISHERHNGSDHRAGTIILQAEKVARKPGFACITCKRSRVVGTAKTESKNTACLARREIDVTIHPELLGIAKIKIWKMKDVWMPRKPTLPSSERFCNCAPWTVTKYRVRRNTVQRAWKMEYRSKIQTTTIQLRIGEILAEIQLLAGLKSSKNYYLKCTGFTQPCM